MKELIGHISEKIHPQITSYRSVSGGDISSAYLLQTEASKYFLKVNSKPFALAMFHAEHKGLQAIEETKTIAVPYVHLVDSVGGKSFLLMDFVESKRPDSSDYQRLGTQLAKLHQCTNTDFGFSTDNFIGSLSQRNMPHKNWSKFYWTERILPQLQLALDNRLLAKNEIPREEKAVKLFDAVFGTVQPSLLHGDLWSGNYLIASGGTPYLIDPATYYGHSMVDIAMSRLFGGFGQSFYDAYHEIMPKTENYNEQIELYQLYYLLVHLNLFGRGYYEKVSAILRHFG
ncbi:MAG: fructosamine kinase family protein [Petrimonas sp.]|nr:fructosamine kinase family protein [Petrimonas sp.]